MYFPRLLEMRQRIAERIAAFFQSNVQGVLATAGFTQYIVDFALVGEQHDRVRLLLCHYKL